MTRSNAREIACHLVFEMNFNNITAGEALQTLMDDGYYPTLKTETDVYAEKPDGKQLEYLTSVVQGVQAKREELEGYIRKYAIGWDLKRISRTALAVLRCAICEILYMDDIPNAAAINEAVELDKGYDEPDVVSFVNGVLGRIARQTQLPADAAFDAALTPRVDESADETDSDDPIVLDTTDMDD